MATNKTQISLCQISKELLLEKEHFVYIAGERIQGSLELCGYRGYKVKELQLKLTCSMSDEPIMTPFPYGILCSGTQGGVLIAQYPAEPECSYKFPSPVSFVDNGQTTSLHFSLETSPLYLSSIVGRGFYNWYGIALLGQVIPPNEVVGMTEVVAFMMDIIILGSIIIPPTPTDSSTQVVKSCSQKFPSGAECVMTVTLERTAYVPGENLKFEVQVINGLHLPLAGVRLGLVEKATYKIRWTRIQRNSEKKFVMTKIGPQIPPGPGRKGVWKGILEIPYLVPTGLGTKTSKEIGIEYFLVFTFTKILNLRVEFPLFIGTNTDDSSRSLYAKELTKHFFQGTKYKPVLSEPHIQHFPSLLSLDTLVPQEEIRGRPRSLSIASTGSMSTLSLGPPPSYRSRSSSIQTLPPPTYEEAVGNYEDHPT